MMTDLWFQDSYIGKVVSCEANWMPVYGQDRREVIGRKTTLDVVAFLDGEKNDEGKPTENA